MLRLKHYFFIYFILSSLTATLYASSNERADHNKLKRFLDCQLKEQKDCKLERPKNSGAKKDSKKQVEVEEKKPTPSQKFIFSPGQKRVKKGNSSPR